MKNKRKLTARQEETVATILAWVFVIVVLVIIFGGAYLIANSNLPDWFKFFLLK